MLSLAAATFAYSFSPMPAPLAAPHAAAAARVCSVSMEEGVASLPPTAAQKTWFPKSADTAKSAKTWYVVDADGLRLGRMASECAKILLGKNKATFTPGADVGDAIVIINADKVTVTGNKRKEKLYRRHSGRPGGMKIESFEELQLRVPERIVEKAIVGMLPKNAHGRNLFRNLKVYAGPEHPHDAQSPEPLTFGGLTSTPDTQVLEYLDPDAPKCVN
jgi:large subunit ribosomal protein L13